MSHRRVKQVWISVADDSATAKEQTTEPDVERALADAVRTVEEVRALLRAANDTDPADHTASVRSKLDAARRALEQAAGAEDTGLGRALLSAEQGLRDVLSNLEERLQKNPIGVLLAAVGVGLLIGLALSQQRGDH